MRPIEILYQLQQTETRLAEIQRTLGSLDTGESLEAEIKFLTERINKGREQLRKWRQELLDRELEDNDIAAKIRQFENLLASGRLRNPRDVEHTQRELDELRRRKDRLEDHMLELMVQVEDSEKLLRELEETRRQKQEQLEATRQQAAQQREQLEQERTVLLQEREQFREMLDESLLTRYERMKARLGGIAVTKVEGNLCGGCRITVTPEVLRAMRDPNALPTCENCGRFLFAG